MTDFLNIIRKPIDAEMQRFGVLFDDALSHRDGTLQAALDYIRRREGKRMRPMLTVLIAKCFGTPNDDTYRAALGLELLHTASLVHDDVVDESDKRRGMKSVNAVFDNRLAVLVGDFVLSTALLNVCKTDNVEIVRILSELGQTLADGEIKQLTSNASDEISEDAYFDIITHKTAALFEACARLGALSVGASKDDTEVAAQFGHTLGIMFQIRDDIFDYGDSIEIGKPTSNDMREGKLTLPAIYALKKADSDTLSIARKVKNRMATDNEIAQLIAYTKQHGGIDYAEKKMQELHAQAMRFVDNRVGDHTLKESLATYLDYIISRDK